MTPPNGLADKGSAVEEWLDLRFFRPAGLALVRAVWRTPVTADQVTAASVLVGLVGGNLFLYPSRALNALGFALLICSEILDSADGQLARLRGTSTRLGRTLDGIGDGVRFVNVYATLATRLLLSGAGWSVGALAFLALLSQSFQAAAVDFVRQAYLSVGVGDAGELDLPENVAPGRTLWHRLVATFYRRYLERQSLIFPASFALVRGLGDRPVPEPLRADYRARQLGVVRRCAWIGQNMHWSLVGVTMLAGWPAGFFWLTLLPLNLVALALVHRHEAIARQLTRDHPPEAMAYARVVA